MTTTQEESANMIVQPVTEVKAKEVLVVVDNTDICVRRLHLMVPRWHSKFDLPY